MRVAHASISGSPVHVKYVQLLYIYYVLTYFVRNIFIFIYFFFRYKLLLSEYTTVILFKRFFSRTVGDYYLEAMGHIILLWNLRAFILRREIFVRVKNIA